MDIVAHALWAWAGGEALRRRAVLTHRTLAMGVVLAVAPDLVQMAPVLFGVLLGQVSLAELRAYVLADPGTEPILREWVSTLAHHLHCLMHSFVVVGTVTSWAWWRRPLWVYPLLGWWLHIATDVPTHSADYYAVPVLYPFTYRGFDGFAWTSPWFIVINYGALGIVGLWLYWARQRPGR